MSTRAFTDMHDLVAIAQQQKKKKAKNARKAKTKKAGPVKKARSKPKAQPKAKKKAAQAPVQAELAMPAASKPGLITHGVRHALDAVGSARSLGLGAWVAVVAMITVGVFVSLAWTRAPAPTALQGLKFTEGVSVPVLLQERWLKSFAGIRELRDHPDSAQLQAFADHLTAQPAVEAVNHMRVVVAGDELSSARRVIEIDLVMREPRLPVMLANGERAWVDQHGVVLPSLLPGPKGQPVVRGYETGGIAAMREVIQLWTALQPLIEPGLVDEVHLSAPLGRENQRGIVLHTRPGAFLVWGAPGESRYGLSTEEKIANLVHTLECQGDLAAVKFINVRFPEPFAIARR